MLAEAASVSRKVRQRAPLPRRRFSASRRLVSGDTLSRVLQLRLRKAENVMVKIVDEADGSHISASENEELNMCVMSADERGGYAYVVNLNWEE
ncbi:hypothetical protein NDU88_002192 [Pleurodeles waltl]|uniref:Uncharacterized protein n=1 Tax=Pleurodeles waltl TaxID=8319 RepID=A0AAV7LEX2_PLEWA|nr:hypothetical protein NDU88_002192 [Pleurodeles waltl]